jgi:RNA polymerase sigma-70 factor (ECF subfamily)
MKHHEEQTGRGDTEIIADIKAGRELAVDELIKKYQKRVYNTAYGLTLDYDEAWDVSQEAMVKLVRYIGSFRGDSSFWTFLYRVIMNTFYDHKRRQKARAKIGDFTSYENDDDKRPFEIKDVIDIEQDYEQKVLKEKLKGALGLLTDAQKKVFVLKNTEGLKIREVAAILGMSDGTVKSHLNRAVDKIKKELGGGES